MVSQTDFQSLTMFDFISVHMHPSPHQIVFLKGMGRCGG